MSCGSTPVSLTQSYRGARILRAVFMTTCAPNQLVHNGPSGLDKTARETGGFLPPRAGLFERSTGLVERSTGLVGAQ